MRTQHTIAMPSAPAMYLRGRLVLPGCHIPHRLGVSVATQGAQCSALGRAGGQLLLRRRRASSGGSHTRGGWRGAKGWRWHGTWGEGEAGANRLECRHGRCAAKDLGRAARGSHGVSRVQLVTADPKRRELWLLWWNRTRCTYSWVINAKASFSACARRSSTRF